MKILTIICLMITFSAISQEPAKIENDTLYYAGQKYWEGKEIRMGYGSAQNKDFAFINFSSGLSASPAGAGWSKSVIKIDKLYKQQGKCYIRGKIKGLAMNKAIVDIEGAIDNKELLTD